MSVPDRFAVEAAYQRIRPYVRETPVLALEGAAVGHDVPILLKLELFQHAGSFKPRGAFNNLLSRPVPAAGVAAASGGNHGAAVAYAAGQLGHPAHIFVPEIASPAKLAKIRSEGASLHVLGARYTEALAACEAHQATSGAIGIHAYNATETIAGQGTVALEWEAQARAAGSGLDTVLVAVGGAGLISGIAAWFAGSTKVIGVEPQGAATLHAAIGAGKPVDIDVDSVAADSLGASAVGDLNYTLCSRFVDQVLLVDDETIRDAMRFIWRRLQIAVEPGGAAALAALTTGTYAPEPGERIGVLLCGGNVDLSLLHAML